MSTLGSYTEVLGRRKDALMAVQAVSSELLDMLVSGDLDNLTEVLDRREKACDFLSRVLAVNPELSAVMAKVRQSVSESSLQPAADLLGLDRDIQTILADVVEKQRMCEELLKAEIVRTSELLKQSASRRRLNNAYGPANARPQAQFIDRAR